MGHSLGYLLYPALMVGDGSVPRCAFVPRAFPADIVWALKAFSGNIRESWAQATLHSNLNNLGGFLPAVVGEVLLNSLC